MHSFIALAILALSVDSQTSTIDNVQ